MPGAAGGRGRGARRDVQLGEGGRGRGGDAAGGAEGRGHAAPPRPRGLAAAVPLLGGHVDADLDGLPLLQRQVQLLGGSLLLLLDLLLCLKNEDEAKRFDNKNILIRYLCILPTNP